MLEALESLYSWFLVEVLSVSPIEFTGVVRDDLIRLLLLPHLILVLMVYALSVALTENRFLRFVVSLGVYSYVVYAGLYPALVSLSQAWWLLATVTGLFLLYAKIVKPAPLLRSLASVLGVSRKRRSEFFRKEKDRARHGGT